MTFRMVSDPVTDTPARGPGTVRRSSHVDMIWLPVPGVEAGPTTRLVIGAGARDVVGSSVVAEGTLSAWIGEANVIEHLTTSPPVDQVGSLVGRSAGSGFRAAARALVPGREDEPIGLLLDDLPVAVLISGYGLLYTGHLRGPIGRDDPAGHMRDLCSGWRSDGVMVRSLERGEGVPVCELSPAPDLGRDDDPLAVEDLPPPYERALRRRRRIDVTPGDPVVVDATFRDTYGAPDGEGILHEYRVHATVSADGLLASLSAEPRVLPWPECPVAADHVGALVGTPVADLARETGRTLTGLGSCTHLNDLLRSLSCVPRLVGLAT